ncbi:MAG: carbamoyltransferase [Bacteroidota bacterium]
MKILGISAYYHDSAAAITVNGKVVAAAQEEWFTRLKHDPSFPEHAIRWVLEYAGVSLDELDAIAFYDKPFLKFERILETYYQHAPRGLGSFIRSMPVWIKEKIFLKQQLRKALKELYPDTKDLPKLLFPEHHLSHAASAFYPSPYERAAIVTVDGVGEWATASICVGEGNSIEILKELHFPDSLGLLYSSFTYFLGFKVNFGEYKLMGLAPYGNLNAPQTQAFIQSIQDELITIHPDGSIVLKASYFTFSTGARMIDDKKWEKLFGFPRRQGEAALEQKHCNLAIAIQDVTEQIILKIAATAAGITGAKHLCLAGGVALNCVANGHLLRARTFDDIWIQPAAGDAGGALGAALAAHYLYFEQERTVNPRVMDAMQGAYLGPEYSLLDIQQIAKKYEAAYEQLTDAELCNKVATLLAEGQVVGWYQGRQEFGPRALGSRSILGDARNPEMQRKLNLKIKFRESFRPFAPSVLAQDVSEYFELEQPSPYMLLVAPVKETRKKDLPATYDQLPLKEKISIERSDIPAVTHIDFSARVQTVHQETNPLYHQLIQAFKAQTGYGLLVNTSFNVRGEPVVCSPDDAFRCFVRTHMDYLVMGNFLFAKTDQPDNHKIQAAKAEAFALD